LIGFEFPCEAREFWYTNMGFLENLNQVNCIGYALAGDGEVEERFRENKKPLAHYGLREVPLEDASVLVVLWCGEELIVHHMGRIESDRNWVSHREENGAPVSFVRIADFVKTYEKPGEFRIVGVGR